MYARFLTALILISWLAAWLVTPGPVQAAGIAVTTTTDEISINGNCSLREAIQAVNTGQVVDQCDGLGGGNEILLQPGQTYRLTRITPDGSADTPADGDLDIRTEMALIGNAQNRAVIDASGLGDRVLHIRTALPVSISGVEIRGGEGKIRGGGIYVEAGVIALNAVTVTGNVSDSVGGGISVGGGASVTVYNGMITENAAVHGGGVFNSGTFVMIESSLMNNAAAIHQDSTGAGLANNAQSGGYAMLINSTVAGNRNTFGANRSAGIFSSAKLVLENVTIVENQGVGLQFTDSLLALSSVVKNSIIARQQDGANCVLPGGSSVVVYGRHNLADDTSCQLNPAVDVVLSGSGMDGIGLTPDSFGTQTLMYGLLTGSPALGQGVDCQGFDQRGLVRQAACDLGSFELGAKTPFFTNLPLVIR